MTIVVPAVDVELQICGVWQHSLHILHRLAHRRKPTLDPAPTVIVIGAVFGVATALEPRIHALLESPVDGGNHLEVPAPHMPLPRGASLALGGSTGLQKPQMYVALFSATTARLHIERSRLRKGLGRQDHPQSEPLPETYSPIPTPARVQWSNHVGPLPISASTVHLPAPCVPESPSRLGG